LGKRDYVWAYLSRFGQNPNLAFPKTFHLLRNELKTYINWTESESKPSFGIDCNVFHSSSVLQAWT